MFAGGIVDADHRKGKLPGAVHRLQAVDAGSRLFTSADDARDQLRHLIVDHVDEIAAIINDDIRPVFQHMADMGKVFLLSSPVPGMHFQAVGYKSSSHIILG